MFPEQTIVQSELVQEMKSSYIDYASRSSSEERFPTCAMA